VAAIYGASGSVKTFILLDLLLHIALGWPWAGRRVVQAPTIYIAAEGAAGLHKRKIGWEIGT
jgi:RecA-family ATPase